MQQDGPRPAGHSAHSNGTPPHGHTKKSKWELLKALKHYREIPGNADFILFLILFLLSAEEHGPAAARLTSPGAAAQAARSAHPSLLPAAAQRCRGRGAGWAGGTCRWAGAPPAPPRSAAAAPCTSRAWRLPPRRAPAPPLRARPPPRPLAERRVADTRGTQWVACFSGCPPAIGRLSASPRGGGRGCGAAPRSAVGAGRARSGRSRR